MSAGIEAASLYVTVGEQGVQATIDKMLKMGSTVDKYANSKVTATVSANIDQATANLNSINAKAEAFKRLHPETTLLFNQNPAIRAIGEVQAKIRELKSSAGQTISLKLTTAIKGAAGLGANALMSGGLNAQAVGATALQHIAAGGPMTGPGGMLDSVGGPVGLGVGAAIGIGALALSKAGEMEKFQTQLSVLLGGMDKAQTRMAELTTFAQTTPFELPEVVNASKVLQVFTGDALSTGKGLQLVGDVAAGTGSNFGETAMWFGRLYDAMKSGKPFGEATMRLQEMGAMSGASRAKIESLAGKVKDGSMTMDEAWKMAGGEFGRFSGMMDKQSGTLEGKMSNLSDAIGQDFAKIGTFLLPVAKIVLDVLIGAFSVLGPVIGVVGNAVGVFIGFMMNLAGVLGGILSGPLSVFSNMFGLLGDVVRNVAGFIGNAAGAIGDFFASADEKALKAAQAVSAAQVEMSKSADAMAADSRESGHIMMVSAQGAGAAVTDMAASAADAATTEAAAFKKMQDAADRLHRDLLSNTQSTVKNYYDVLIMQDKLAANSAEISAAKRTIASSKSSKAEIHDATVTLHQLESDRADMEQQLAEHGATQSKIFKKTMAQLLVDLAHAHGTEKTAIYAEITAIELLSLKAAIAAGKMLTLNQRITASLAKGGYVNAAGAAAAAANGSGKSGGGHVIGGHAYPVNENTRNSEIFVPSGNGYIIPSLSERGPMAPSFSGGGGRGGATVQINARIDATAAMTPAVGAHIVQTLGPLLGDWLKQNGYIPQGSF